MKKLIYVTQITLFFLATVLFAQDRSLQGTVTDANGMPLPGASVVVKNTTIGVVTDFDGNFTIAVPANENLLEVTFMGFKSQEVDITGKSEITIN